MIDIIVFSFSVFIIMYVLMNCNNMTNMDKIMLFVSVLVLLGTYIRYKTCKSLESFEDGSRYIPVSTEEDITGMITRTIIYLTVFNSKSFTGSGNKWMNVSHVEKPGCTLSDNKAFTFTDLPVYTRRSGISLGSNKLLGPYSNQMGISLQSTFTIFLGCKHGDFVEGLDSEVEFLKLYANSSTNNGLALYIQANTIDVENNIQKGVLLFKYTDNTTSVPCVLSPRDTTFTFDKINPTYFFIVKELDKVRIVYAQGGSSRLTTIASINITDTIATLSNKEMVINRFQNWKGSIFNFGVINEAIPDNEISSLFNAMYAEYIKLNSDEYMDLVENYNKLIEALNTSSKCPYDEATCTACGSITSWSDISQILGATDECKKAIATFCVANPTHPQCKCWNKTSTDYGSSTCSIYRDVFDPASKACVNSISQADVGDLKTKFGLVSAAECVKPADLPKLQANQCQTCVPDKLVKNNYMEYDESKLKINMSNDPTNLSSSINIPYKDDSSIRDHKVETEFKTSVAITASNVPPPPPVAQEEQKSSDATTSTVIPFKDRLMKMFF